MYDAESQELIEEIEGTSEVMSVAIWDGGTGGKDGGENTDESKLLVVAGFRDGTIKVWNSGAPFQITPPWPKLMPAGLSGRRAGAAEREDERPQQSGHVSGVFPGRDQDCVWIGRPDDQGLGFWCAGALKSPLLGQN